jgi:hypothetical protein
LGEALVNDAVYNALASRALCEPRDADFIVNEEEALEIFERSTFLTQQPPTAEEARDAWLSIKKGTAKFCGKTLILKT